MGRPKKAQSSDKVSKIKSTPLKSNERFMVNDISGMNGWKSIVDTKYNIIYEFEDGNFEKTKKQRPLENISALICRQSMNDVTEFIKNEYLKNINPHI